MFEDDAERTKAIGVWGASFAVGGRHRAANRGVLLEHFWWGAVFLVGVPIMVLLLIADRSCCPSTAIQRRTSRLLSALLVDRSVLAVIYG